MLWNFGKILVKFWHYPAKWKRKLLFFFFFFHITLYDFHCLYFSPKVMVMLTRGDTSWRLLKSPFISLKATHAWISHFRNFSFLKWYSFANIVVMWMLFSSFLLREAKQSWQRNQSKTSRGRCPWQRGCRDIWRRAPQGSSCRMIIMIIATFRLEYEDDYEYEFQVLSTRNSKIFALQT